MNSYDIKMSQRPGEAAEERRNLRLLFTRKPDTSRAYCRVVPDSFSAGALFADVVAEVGAVGCLSR
jgi:hypothetical protein